MKVLVIRFARFGDVVLLLPALSLLKAAVPDCHLTVLTDKRLHSLVAMCPAVDDIVSVDRLQMRDGAVGTAIKSMGGLVRDLRHRRFDSVIDCHSFRETNLLTWLTGAAQRVGLKRADQSFLRFCFNRPPVLEDKSIHVAEMFRRTVASFVPVESGVSTNSPTLVIPAETQEWVRIHLPAQPFVAFYVDAPVKERMWPLDRFLRLANHFHDRHKVEVVALASRPIEEELGRDVRVFRDLSTPQLAAAIASARMLVSNDTGPMHLGPTLGVPTLALFSVGIPTHFRPTGPLDAYVRECPIERLELNTVIAAADRIWNATAGSDLRC